MGRILGGEQNLDANGTTNIVIPNNAINGNVQGYTPNDSDFGALCSKVNQSFYIF